MCEKERKGKREKEVKEIDKRSSITFKIIFNVVGSIPEIEDIPKTPDTFWKETTWNKLINGSDGGDKINIYKDQGSSFIRCHNIESNNETIHILQEDETISDGIYRYRYDDGNTAIGSQYFRRSGREEGRLNSLCRFNNGDIYYYDQIWGKDDSSWRILATYRFNPETLDWSKFI